MAMLVSCPLLRDASMAPARGRCYVRTVPCEPPSGLGAGMTLHRNVVGQSSFQGKYSSWFWVFSINMGGGVLLVGVLIITRALLSLSGPPRSSSRGAGSVQEGIILASASSFSTSCM